MCSVLLTGVIYYCVTINIANFVEVATRAEMADMNEISRLEGRYTRELSKYHLAIPRRVDANGNFVTFKIPQFYTRDYWPGAHKGRRRKRASQRALHYHLEFDGRRHHLELWPNHNFMAPNLLVEWFAPNPRDRRLRQASRRQCHYTGHVRGIHGSQAALSLCDGMTGLVATERGQYLVEPVHGHGANMLGQHLHVVHARDELRRAPRDRLTAAPHDGVASDRDKAIPADTAGTCGTRTNWAVAWADRFRDQYSEALAEDAGGPAASARRRDLSVATSHRYVEALLVADKKFLDWHRDDDYESYLLTIMNMVSNYYHDASVGSLIDVVVSRIIYLDKEEEEIDLDINPDADKSLASFCKWQRGINFDEEHPNHHDIAALITRHNICSTDTTGTSCSLLGLAYVSGACKPESCCSINQDSGLELGIVLTHELGHLLGSGHDAPGESSCEAQREDGFYNVMSPYIKVATTVWSACSKAFISTLMSVGLGDCLRDEPADSIYKTIDVLPGVVYDMDFQCKSMASKRGACGFKSCKSIRCYVSETGCGYYPGNPPFDGTTCGNNKWCFREECIEQGERPEAVNGGWGEWSAWSTCSRTCGGGVTVSERECNTPVPAHGGQFCLGDHKQLKMCNTQSCGPKTPSYKDFQCSMHNSEGKKFESFVPSGKVEPCKLYCLQLPSGPYRKYPAADGTRCKGGTKNICVSNACQAVGCDFEFGSDAVEDRCGVCRGDGTSCKEVKGIFNETPNFADDIMEMVHIPMGARSIHVAEEDASPSYLMVATDVPEGERPEMLLNDVGFQEEDISKDIGGVTAIYTHQKTGLDNLWIHEPLVRPLVIWLIAHNFSNPGFSWSYMLAKPQTERIPIYHWETVEMSPCSAVCGGGTQEAQLDCVESETGKVDHSFCATITKPKTVAKECNMQPCASKWQVSNWGACSGCRTRMGFRARSVECMRESHIVGGENVVVEATECNDTKPYRVELCHSMRSCAGVADPFGAFRKKMGSNSQQTDLLRQMREDPGMALYSYDAKQKHKYHWRKRKQHWHKKTCDYELETEEPPSREFTETIPTTEEETTTKYCLQSNFTPTTTPKIYTTLKPPPPHYEENEDDDSENPNEEVHVSIKPIVVGERVKDYEAHENLDVVEVTTQNVLGVPLDDKAFEEMGADVDISNMGTESSRSNTTIQVVEGDDDDEEDDPGAAA